MLIERSRNDVRKEEPKGGLELKEKNKFPISNIEQQIVYSLREIISIVMQIFMNINALRAIKFFENGLTRISNIQHRIMNIQIKNPIEINLSPEGLNINKIKLYIFFIVHRTLTKTCLFPTGNYFNSYAISMNIYALCAIRLL